MNRIQLCPFHRGGAQRSHLNGLWQRRLLHIRLLLHVQDPGATVSHETGGDNQPQGGRVVLMRPCCNRTLSVEKGSTDYNNGSLGVCIDNACWRFDMGLHCNYVGHTYIAHGKLRLDVPYTQCADTSSHNTAMVHQSPIHQAIEPQPWVGTFPNCSISSTVNCIWLVYV